MDKSIKVDFDVVQQFSDDLSAMIELLEDKKNDMLSSIDDCDATFVGDYSNHLHTAIHDLMQHDMSLGQAFSYAWEYLSQATNEIYDADLASQT